MTNTKQPTQSQMKATYCPHHKLNCLSNQHRQLQEVWSATSTN